MQGGTTRRADIAFAFTLAVLLYVGWELRSILLLIYLSIVFAIVFTPAVGAVQRLHVRTWRPSRGLAIVVLVAAAASAFTGFALLIIPQIAGDVRGFAGELPRHLTNLERVIERYPLGNRLANALNPAALQQHLAEVASRVLTSVQALAGGITNLLLTAILTAYFILEGRQSFEWGMSLVPPGQRPRLRQALLEGGRRMQRWLAGQILLMLILGFSSLVVFWLLGIRYYYALALFAGLANFVPIIGPIATVVLAGLVAALDSWLKLLGVVVFYLIYQQIENAYLTPHIMRTTVELPAVAVIVALTIGGALAGIAGAIVAVPTAALIATIVKKLLVEDAAHSRSQDHTA